MAEVLSFVGTEYDTFYRKAVQSAVLESIETIYKPIASVDQTDIEFSVPGDSETYIDLELKLFIKGKLTKKDGTDLDNTDFTAGINNFLHSLFSQCTISLNGTQITQVPDLYNYGAYIETLLIYGNDAAASHLTNGTGT